MAFFLPRTYLAVVLSPAPSRNSSPSSQKPGVIVPITPCEQTSGRTSAACREKPAKGPNKYVEGKICRGENMSRAGKKGRWETRICQGPPKMLRGQKQCPEGAKICAQGWQKYVSRAEKCFFSRGEHMWRGKICSPSGTAATDGPSPRPALASPAVVLPLLPTPPLLPMVGAAVAALASAVKLPQGPRGEKACASASALAPPRGPRGDKRPPRWNAAAAEAYSATPGPLRLRGSPPRDLHLGSPMVARFPGAAGQASAEPACWCRKRRETGV